MNAGEKDELLIKLKLIEMRDNGIPFFGETIVSVGFGDVEYLSVPVDFSFGRALDDESLTHLCHSIGIRKGSTFDKSDVYINGSGYSLKSLSAAPPALVNHTRRDGFEFACTNVGMDIARLDTIVDRYWESRLSGRIKEDVPNAHPFSPFSGEQETLSPILQYFLFTGTGSRVSEHPAEFILEYRNPLDAITWRKIDPDTAIDELWPYLFFSIRAKKGMPSNYNPDTYRGENAESIMRWTRFTSGDYRGALHVRALIPRPRRRA